MTTPFEISCVILCGGKSSRMGEDKALLPFENSNTLTAYQYDRLKPYFKNVYISSKIDKFDFLENVNDLILDEGEIFSPIIALQTIMNKFENEKIFIITVDTPLVSLESINAIIESSKDYDITVAKTQRTHNLCGVFSTCVKKVIDDMLIEDIHKVGYLLKNSNTKIVELDDDNEFINLNNKDEYNKALQLINSSKITK